MILMTTIINESCGRLQNSGEVAADFDNTSSKEE